MAEKDLEAAPTKKLFLVEIWEENREVLKAAIEHPLLFSIPILSLLGFDYIIRHSALEQEQKHILESIDFYGIAAALGIFTVSFIIRLGILILWRIRHGK